MTELIIKIFFLAFFINLLYELIHSVLYETCLKIPLKKYVPLIIKASLVDGIWITGFYLITYYMFKNINIFNNNHQLTLFFVISISFAYFWEIYSTKNNRWQYSKNMPLVAGAGLTPLIQLFSTGILSFYIIFYLL